MFMSFANAKTYKVFIGTSAGSSSDIQTRKLFDGVSEITGDSFVILNKPGASFIVSYKAFMEESRNDKNVILFNTTSLLVNKYVLGAGEDIDPLNDIKGLMALQKVNYFIAVRSDSNIHSLKDIDKKVNIGTTSAVSDLLVKNNFKKFDYQIIPYKSENESMLALLKGEIDVASTHSINTVITTQRNKFRIINVYPENMVGLVGYSVLKDFPNDDLIRLNRAMNNVLSNQDFSAFGTGFLGGSPEKYDDSQKKTFNEILRLK